MLINVTYRDKSFLRYSSPSLENRKNENPGQGLAQAVLVQEGHEGAARTLGILQESSSISPSITPPTSFLPLLLCVLPCCTTSYSQEITIFKHQNPGSHMLICKRLSDVSHRKAYHPVLSKHENPHSQGEDNLRPTQRPTIKRPTW